MGPARATGAVIAVSAWLGLIVAAASCGTFVDFDGLVGSTPCRASECDADAPRDGRADATLDGADEPLGDAGPLDDGDADGRALADVTPDLSAPCPGRPLPTGVRVPGGAGSYCIDATEVTRGHYEQFWREKRDAGVGGQIAICTWNTDYTPDIASFPVRGEEELPVTGVDWCDGWAYCAWAGKRLCGAIGGGALPYALALERERSQWVRACGGAAASPYPYGATYDAGRCNDDSRGTARPALVTGSTCVGGYAGITDMSGNVWEWLDACQGSGRDAGDDTCRKLGGAFNSTPSEGMCAFEASERRAGRFPTLGFRCCSDP